MSISVRGRVLVTRGAGSFGSTMVRRLVETDVDEIRILCRDEAHQDAMRREFCSRPIKSHVSDVSNARSVEDAVIGVARSVHAAALMQVRIAMQGRADSQ